MPDKTLSSFLATPRLLLRPLEPADADGDYPSWLNSAEVSRGNSHHVLPYTRSAAREYIEQVSSGPDLVLAIVVREGARHVGNISLQGVHPLFRSAELAILIGGSGSRGKGIGLEAAQVVCSHGFRAMNLHRIACATYAHNVAMQRLANALGMREEGRRREAAFKDGRYVDVIEYGLLRAESSVAPDSPDSREVQ